MREFGKYTLVSQIGAGGMAEVFQARSPGAEGLEKLLVIKRILPEYAKRSKFVSMFIDEAKVAVSLNHPNIAQVYEFGKVGSDYYLAMEFVDGTDLGRALNGLKRLGQRLDTGDAVYIAIEVAKALDYAHRKTDDFGRPLSIVHRDVSPQNILITWDGSVKLLDFGIAKARHTAGQRSRVVKGKTSYMAPEQAQGKPVDQRTDVFSLGAVLFEMLAGRPPFPRGKPTEVLSVVRSGIIPDLRSFVPELDDQLHHIVMKALAAKPENRYESARALQVDLMRYLFSLGRIHDSGSLAEVLGELRSSLIRPRPPGEPERSTRATVVTTGRSTRAEGTQTHPTHTTRDLVRTLAESETPPTATPVPLVVPPFRERRETFVIVGELLGFTELRAHVSDDRWRGVLFDYMPLVEAVAFKSQCAVDRVDERGFLLLAGVPVSTENDAETAIRVARDLIEAIDAMSVNLVQPLQLSVGIAPGGLVLERSRQGEEERYKWVPDEPDWRLARNLAMHAMPGEILVDGFTARSARHSYEYSELRDVDPRELGEGASVFRVERPKSSRQRLLERRKSFTTLHGRDFELRLLRQSFEETTRKKTVRTVVFAGEPGVGKASIVEEFLSGLSAERVRVIRSTCSADTQERPFAPVAAMLVDLFDLEDTGDIRALKNQLEARSEALLTRYDANEKRYILHAVALLFNIKYPGNVIEALEPQRRRARMFLSLRRLLGAAAQQGGAVLVVNDCHWADQSSLEFLAEVVRERRKRPILVVLTVRKSPTLMGSHVWHQLVEGRDVIVHEVHDLPPHAARALILDLLDRPMEPRLVDQIVERSGGNPLFIKEIMESLQEDDLLVERHGALSLGPEISELEVPATVEGIVAGRIGSLPAGPKMVLLGASLIGREIEARELEAVFGELPVADLEVLIERGFMSALDGPGGAGRYRITKGLTRQVAAKGLIEQERQEIHARLAEHLIARETDLARSDLAAIAKHLAAAGDADDAGQYYLLAATEALNSSGLMEARTLVDRALDLLPDDSHFRFSALDLKERLLKDLGRATERREILGELRHFVARFGPAEHAVQVLVRTARFELDMGRMEVAETALREALRKAQEIGDAAGKGLALAWLASLLRNVGQEQKAREACEAALAIYEEVDEPEGAATAWNQMGILYHQQDRLEDALSAYQRVVDLAKRAGLRSMEEVARVNMGFCLVKMGELERAVNTYRQVLHEILQLGHRRIEAALLANLGHAQVLLGDFTRAEHTLKRSVRLSKRNQDAGSLADGLLTLAVAHLARGRLDEVEKALRPGLEAAEEAQDNYLLCHAYLISAELRLRRRQTGDLEASLEDTEQVLELAGAQGHLFARCRATSLRARCLARMDREGEAVEASERAVALLAEGTVEGAEEVLYHHALLMLRVDRESEARRAVAEAYRRFDEKRMKIKSSKTRENFERVRANRRIIELYQELPPFP